MHQASSLIPSTTQDPEEVLLADHLDLLGTMALPGAQQGSEEDQVLLAAGLLRSGWDGAARDLLGDHPAPATASSGAAWWWRLILLATDPAGEPAVEVGQSLVDEALAEGGRRGVLRAHEALTALVRHHTGEDTAVDGGLRGIHGRVLAATTAALAAAPDDPLLTLALARLHSRCGTHPAWSPLAGTTAEGHQRQAFQLRRELHHRQGDEPQAAFDLAISWFRTAQLSHGLGSAEATLEALRRFQALMAQALDADPHHRVRLRLFLTNRVLEARELAGQLEDAELAAQLMAGFLDRLRQLVDTAPRRAQAWCQALGVPTPRHDADLANDAGDLAEALAEAHRHCHFDGDRAAALALSEELVPRLRQRYRGQPGQGLALARSLGLLATERARHGRDGSPGLWAEALALITAARPEPEHLHEDIPHWLALLNLLQDQHTPVAVAHRMLARLWRWQPAWTLDDPTTVTSAVIDLVLAQARATQHLGADDHARRCRGLAEHLPVTAVADADLARLLAWQDHPAWVAEALRRGQAAPAAVVALLAAAQRGAWLAEDLSAGLPLTREDLVTLVGQARQARPDDTELAQAALQVAAQVAWTTNPRPLDERRAVLAAWRPDPLDLRREDHRAWHDLTIALALNAGDTPALRQALVQQIETLRTVTLRDASAGLALADALAVLAQEEDDQAQALREEALAVLEQIPEDDRTARHAYCAMQILLALAHQQVAEGRWSEAHRLLAEARDLGPPWGDPDPEIANAQAILAEIILLRARVTLADPAPDEDEARVLYHAVFRFTKGLDLLRGLAGGAPGDPARQFTLLTALLRSAHQVDHDAPMQARAWLVEVLERAEVHGEALLATDRLRCLALRMDTLNGLVNGLVPGTADPVLERRLVHLGLDLDQTEDPGPDPRRLRRLRMDQALTLAAILLRRHAVPEARAALEQAGSLLDLNDPGDLPFLVRLARLQTRHLGDLADATAARDRLAQVLGGRPLPDPERQARLETLLADAEAVIASADFTSPDSPRIPGSVD